MRPITPILLLGVLALSQGCVTKKVKKALAEETRASLTVSGDAAILAAIQEQLPLLYKVGVNVETIEKGILIVRIVGAYAEVLHAINWLILQNLRLIANDEVTKSLLAIALSALK